MKGRINRYDRHVAAGVILGDDRNRYEFQEPEWWGEGEPVPDQDVDFLDDGPTARAVIALNGENARSHH